MKQIHRIHYFRLNEGGILNKNYKNISKIPSIRKNLQEDRDYIVNDEQLKQTAPGDLIKSYRDLSIDHIKDVLINRHNYGQKKLTRNSSVFYKNTNTARELLLPKEKRTLNYYLNENIIVKRLKEEKEKEKRKNEFKKILLSDNEQMWDNDTQNGYSTEYLEEQLKIIQNYENQLMEEADLNKFDYTDSIQYIQDDNDENINSFDLMDDSPVVMLQNQSHVSKNHFVNFQDEVNNEKSSQKTDQFDNSEEFQQDDTQSKSKDKKDEQAEEVEEYKKENELNKQQEQDAQLEQVQNGQDQTQDNPYQVIAQCNTNEQFENEKQNYDVPNSFNDQVESKLAYDDDDQFGRDSETKPQKTKQESDEDFD